MRTALKQLFEFAHDFGVIIAVVLIIAALLCAWWHDRSPKLGHPMKSQNWPGQPAYP